MSNSQRVIWKKNENGDLQPPTRFILATCRATTSDENVILNKHFKNIVSYHSELNAGNFDLSQLAFDLLIIDVSNKANHVFLEVINNQAKVLQIPIIVLKKSMTNYHKLVDALGASVISSVEDFDKKDFLLYLTRSKLPKLSSRIKHFLKMCLGVLLKQ